MVFDTIVSALVHFVNWCKSVSLGFMGFSFSLWDFYLALLVLSLLSFAFFGSSDDDDDD